MVLSSNQFPSFVDFDPVLTEIYFSQYERDLGMGGVATIFRMLTSSKAKETDQRVGGFADPETFNGTVKYDTPRRGYQIEYTFDELVKGFAITRKMRDDLQYDTIFDSAMGMATAFARKRRKDAASVFNNATSSSYLGYDSVALCSNSHPRSRVDTSNTVDNLGAYTLTSPNLETAVLAMQGFQDELGEEITITPDILVVPRALRKTALEIVGSEKVPENANNAINVQANGWTVVVDPYLTSTSAWWIIDGTLAKRYLKWYDRIGMEFAGTQDFDTMVWKYRGYVRYGYGWSDFRWLYQGNS